MRLDSHHHFWNFSPLEYPWIDDAKSSLKQDFGPAELMSVVKPAGIERVVAVQARQTPAETEWLLGLAEQHDLVAGVVGWFPLMRELELSQTLERFGRHRKLVGVRHVVQDEPDDGFILGEAFNRGVARLKDFDLVYDILIFAKQLKPTIEFVDRHPAQRFVLDHIAKPTIARGRFDRAWEIEIRELAKRENVVCKFSALTTEVTDAEWDVPLLRPYWDVVVEAFGPKRLMFGSDWPVCLLRTEYARWVAAVEELSAGLSEDERRSFWGTTALQTYQLNVPAP